MFSCFVRQTSVKQFFFFAADAPKQTGRYHLRLVTILILAEQRITLTMVRHPQMLRSRNAGLESANRGQQTPMQTCSSTARLYLACRAVSVTTYSCLLIQGISNAVCNYLNPALSPHIYYAEEFP